MRYAQGQESQGGKGGGIVLFGRPVLLALVLRPCSSYSRLRLMKLMPKPLATSFGAVRPPDSVQVSITRLDGDPGTICHETSRWPPGPARAPYFTALVANS